MAAGWSWLGKKGWAAAGALGGLFIVEWVTNPKDQIVSKGGAPDPRNKSFSDAIKFPCESSGMSCTCDDVRDWLGTYWEGTERLVGLVPLEREAYTLSEKTGPGNIRAQDSINATLDFVQDFKKKYEPWKSYNCDDDWYLGKQGRDMITSIVEMIEKVQILHTQIYEQLAELKKPGERWTGIAPNHRPLDEGVYDDGGDDGPDSGSIGLGLLAGGAIALALIMGQSKTKGPV